MADFTNDLFTAMHKDRPDALYVRDIGQFRRNAEQAYVMVNGPAVKADTFAGVEIYVDPALPDGVVELRRGKEILSRVSMEKTNG